MAIMRLSSKVFPSCPPEFVFPLFHRLLQVLANHLSEGQSPLTRSAFWTLDLMEISFQSGNEAMYRVFIDEGWLWMLSERYVANSADWCIEPICAFVHGLHALGSASALECFDYLQQPRNFFITFIALASLSGHLNVGLLLTLCPIDSVLWYKHRHTLDGIIDWCEDTDLPFPVENFFDGKVVQTRKGAVYLNEALQAMLTDNVYRRKVQWAARTILLGDRASGCSEWDC